MSTNQTAVDFDQELLTRYDRAGPRYTSYPTAVQFTEDFAEADYREAAIRSNAAGRPLSLYVHIPFCDTVCFYCACNKIATKDHSRAVVYLERLLKEIQMQGALFSSERVVEQLHFGGGTPTFLTLDEMEQVMTALRENFQLREDDGGEYSIEIDPREADAERVAGLRRLGFNRMSIGIQDLDPTVQKAVNRNQTEAETVEVFDAARREGFRSLNLDLIYGLPHQNAEQFLATVDRVIAMGADRLSVFNYAHLPDYFKPQRRINEADLPSAAEKLRIFGSTIDRLQQAGYVHIGMDHFARPEDELTIAQSRGDLTRNFQGYSTRGDCDLIGLGNTSIGKVDDTYSQNVREVEDYQARIDAGRLPVFRGIRLSWEDRLRRATILELMCHYRLQFESLDQAWGIDSRNDFAEELASLNTMQDDGLVIIDEEGIRVTGRGRLLIRNIAMIFDQYLAAEKGPRYSKVI